MDIRAIQNGSTASNVNGVFSDSKEITQTNADYIEIKEKHLEMLIL